MSLKVLQEALDNRPSADDPDFWFKADKWFEGFARKFATYCAELSDLFEEKRKEWKNAYPLKTKYDFQTRVLIDEIFDELEKVFDETLSQDEKEESK